MSGAVTVVVNGEPRALTPGLTLADLVGELAESAKGVAAAVNGEVVPRRSWPGRTLADRDEVEIVTAVQGG